MARERTEETHTQTLHTTPTEQKKNKSHDRPVETKVVLWERLTVDKQMFCQWSKLAEKKSGDSLIGMPTDKVETQRIRLPIECIFERHSTERKYKNLWAFLTRFVRFFGCFGCVYVIPRPISHNWKVEMVFCLPMYRLQSQPISLFVVHLNGWTRCC